MEPFRLRLERVRFLLVSSIPVGVKGLTLAAGWGSRSWGLKDVDLFSTESLEEATVAAMRDLERTGAGVANIDWLVAWRQWSKSVLGVAGESKSLSART